MERADSKQRAAYKRALRWKANPVRAYTYHNKDGKHITYRLKPFPRDCSHLISREEVREAQKLVDAANAKKPQ